MKTQRPTKAKKSEYIQTALRLPPDVHRAIHEAAQREERTFNGQVVALLRSALPKAAEAHTEMS